MHHMDMGLDSGLAGLYMPHASSQWKPCLRCATAFLNMACQCRQASHCKEALERLPPPPPPGPPPKKTKENAFPAAPAVRRKKKSHLHTNSDTNPRPSLTSCSANCVSSEVNYAPNDIIGDCFGVVIV